MIRKLTLAIVTCPTSSILIQNHSAFHEYFANKRQIKASLSLEIVKKTIRDRMQLPKKVSRPKKVCDRMLLCSTLLRNLGRFPRILTSVSILIVHVLLYEEPIKLEIEIPLSQSFSRRPTADKEPEKLWDRDWARGWTFKNGWEKRASNFIGPAISSWDPTRIWRNGASAGTKASTVWTELPNSTTLITVMPRIYKTSGKLIPR